MGSDRKSKEEKKRKTATRSPSLSDSEDGGKSRKRHRREEQKDGGKRRSKKLDKKEKVKDKDSSKHRSGKDKKLKDKHKGKHHKGDRHSKSKIQELSSDDYFARNNEFATWLKEEKNIFFSDLSSESARELFLDFIKAWNRQKLDSRYYEGISSGPRTAHNWQIKQ